MKVPKLGRTRGPFISLLVGSFSITHSAVVWSGLKLTVLEKFWPFVKSETQGQYKENAIADIFLHEVSGHDEEIVRKERAEIIDPNDLGGKELYNVLRESLKELDTEEGWRRVKEQARAELRFVPPNFIEQILTHTAALVRNMSSGHGKGHVLRDLANLTAIMQDPDWELEKIDEVELFVGINAGLFHDIGNSIVDRYEDIKRVGAHAEVGAVLFGNVARGVIPPNLTRLIQYSIAAHTHYIGGREVKIEDGSVATQQAYEDDTSAGNRQAIWITRQADRMDTANVVHTIRDMIVRTEPIQDFDGKNFTEIKDAEDSFLEDYGIVSASEDKGLVEHEIKFSKNVYRQNPYTSHDSLYFTQRLMTPGVGDIALLLSVIAPEKKDDLLLDVEMNNPAAAVVLKDEIARYSGLTEQALQAEVTPEQTREAMSRFKVICHAFEPARDLEARLAAFEAKFPTLPNEDQVLWTRAFLYIADVLVPRYFDRMTERVNNRISLRDRITSQDPSTRQQFEELGNHLQAVAQQVIEAMSSSIAGS